jgi:hypothetical protein
MRCEWGAFAAMHPLMDESRRLGLGEQTIDERLR